MTTAALAAPVAHGAEHLTKDQAKYLAALNPLVSEELPKAYTFVGDEIAVIYPHQDGTFRQVLMNGDGTPHSYFRFKWSPENPEHDPEMPHGGSWFVLPDDAEWDKIQEAAAALADA